MSSNVSFTLSAGQTLAGAGRVDGSITSSAGTAILPNAQQVGTLTITNTLTLNGGEVLVFDLGALTNEGGIYNDKIAVTNLSLNGVTTIRINPSGVLSNAPYTLIRYSGTFNNNGAFIVESDSRYNFIVDAVSVPGIITVTPDGSGSAKALTWKGGAIGNPQTWDVKNAVNWVDGVLNPETFFAGDTVVFDDAADVTTVTAVGTLIPAGVVATNSTKDITINGAGKLGGMAGVVKALPGKLTLANSGVNDYAGPTVVSSGTLQIGDGGANGNIPTASLVTNNGTLIFNRSDLVTVPNPVSGTDTSANLVKQGTGTTVLTADSINYLGNVSVNDGILRVSNDRSLGATNDATRKVTIQGGTLDLNGNRLLGLKTVEVAGNGYTNVGTVINSGADGINAIRSLKLLGDAAVGGMGGRWDVRATTATDPLITGQGYKFSKVGNNYVAIVGVNNATPVETDLGDIDVVGGILEWTFNPTLGRPDSNLIVRAGASFRLYGTTTNIQYKNLVMMDGSEFRNTTGDNNFGGPISLNGSNLFWVAANSLTLRGPISGTGSFHKAQAANNLILTGTNDFVNPVNVWGGNLIVNNDQSLGSMGIVNLNYNLSAAAGGAGTALLLNNVNIPGGVSATLNTAPGNFRSSLVSNSGTNTWNGSIFLSSLPGGGQAGLYAQGNSYFNILGNITMGSPAYAAGSMFFRGTPGTGVVSGVIDIGTNAFFKTDGGTWVVSSTGNNWLFTAIADGFLYLGINDALPPNKLLRLGQGGTTIGRFDMAGYNQTVAGLDVDPASTVITHYVTNSSTISDSVLTINGTATNVFKAAIRDSGAALGKIHLTVNGGGLTLADNATANSYTGNTMINGGTLALQGTTVTIGTTPLISVGAGALFDVSGRSGYTLAAGQTLAGNGVVTGAVIAAAGSFIAPGASVGTLTFQNTPTLNGTLSMELNKSGMITTSDKIVVDGNPLAYNGTLTLALTGDPITGGEMFDLFDASSFSGTFAATNLPALSPGMNWWLGKLTVDGTVAVNRSPIAGAYSMNTTSNKAVTVEDSKILLRCSDPDADPITIVSVTASTNGAAVTHLGGVITYTPNAGFVGTDRFDYTITDGRGAYVTATIVVDVYTGNTASQNIVGWGVTTNGNRITFAGIPGRSYGLERAAATDGPWTRILDVIAASVGVTDVVDTNPPPAPLFYRTVNP